MAQGFEVFLLVLEECGNGGFEGFFFGVFTRQSGAALHQVLDFGVAQQHGLAGGQGIFAFEVFGLVQQPGSAQAFHRDLRQGLCNARFHQALFDQPGRFARAYRHRHVQVFQGKGIVGHAPMAFEALRGNARADGIAIRQAFGQPRIVAVEQGRRVVVQGVNLQEAGQGHGVSWASGGWRSEWGMHLF